MDILIVDDEPLVRCHLRALLQRSPIAVASAGHIEEAGDAERAAGLLRHRRFDLLLLDVALPGSDGLALARRLREVPQPPAIVFVTGDTAHAAMAFELDALDYLTKPVRPERLEQALHKAVRVLGHKTVEAAADDVALPITHRGVAQRLPLAEVLYLRAEGKVVMARTAQGRFMLDASLAELERRHADRLLRAHRNTLVSRAAMRRLERSGCAVDDGSAEAWHLTLHGAAERLPVSRRQVAQVRQALLR